MFRWKWCGQGGRRPSAANNRPLRGLVSPPHLGEQPMLRNKWASADIDSQLTVPALPLSGRSSGGNKYRCLVVAKKEVFALQPSSPGCSNAGLGRSQPSAPPNRTCRETVPPPQPPEGRGGRRGEDGVNAKTEGSSRRDQPLSPSGREGPHREASARPAAHDTPGGFSTRRLGSRNRPLASKKHLRTGRIQVRNGLSMVASWLRRAEAVGQSSHTQPLSGPHSSSAA